MALINLIFPCVVSAVVYKIVSTIISKKLLESLTAVGDLPMLGAPRKDGRKFNGTVVVCGGSIAGLHSARVCSDHFDRVIMVEPEERITTDEGLDNDHRTEKSSLDSHKRARVAQYSSFHAFQPFLTMAHRKLFPNYDAEISKAGARMVHGDAHMHYAGVPIKAPWHQYKAAEFPDFANLRRAGYETTLRRMVLSECPNVTYITGAVTALIESKSSPGTVDSVSVCSRDGEESSISAALVIDCTGSVLGGFRWLQNLLSLPTKNKKSALALEALKETYDPKMAYTTCEFDVPSKLIPRLNAMGFTDTFETAGFVYVCFPDPDLDKRNLIIARREHNFIQIACGGWDVRDRMTSINDIKIFMSQMVLTRPLPSWIYQMLDLFEAEQVPLTYVYSRCPPAVYIQYHLAENLPSNFIAIGDSVMQLNPIRGQGCTKACLEAVSLDGVLRKCVKRVDGVFPKDFGRKFFAIQAKRTGGLWAATKAQDYGWQTTIPAKGDDVRSTGAWNRAYGSAVTQLMLQDKEVSAVWWHVILWLKPPTDLLSPVIMLKLVWMLFKGYLGL